ncbi:phage tail spike protein [Streptococcus suis]|uniref:phage tail spike protein n=1 Tax=Streptococcus suis TaxID=1307 RepID=UPI0025B0D45B|nr:phage tail spike protein [Streptococcus suis]MDN2963488.1 gp58-like family protein [Streptococcus suis]
MIYLKDGNIPLNLAYDDDIVQEANSTYQLSFKFPLTDGKWNLLRREVFLLADDLHGEQEFFIFEVKKAKGHVQVYAKQVATLLNYYSINSISVDRVPGQTVMTALAGSVKRPCPFTFFSDILDRHTFNESNVSVMAALAKDKHSIVGQWGGDLVRDKYQVKLLKNGGIENESLFMYKKNLSSYEESENINNLKTRLHLKKTIKGQSEGEADRVIAVTVDSPLIGQYRQIYEADIEVNDQDVTDVASLTAYGKRYFSSTLCDLVENSINLDVKGKSDVSVKMFDMVSVFHERFDVDLRLKISSYHFGPMSKRLKSIGFGKVSQSFGSTVASMVAGSVDKATGRLSASFEQKLQKEIDNANRHFDAEFDKRVESINDGIEQAQAEAERYADAIKQEIDTEIAQVNQSMQAQSEEHDRQVADILSKTQSVESLANQAKSGAASALARANQVKTEAIADARAQVATVSQALNTAKSELQTAIASADQKARDSQASATALRNDLNLQASKILEQARAQTALTSRVTTVETLADGTRSTVAELSKTVSKATGDITSVTSRTKTVEDTLSQTRTQYEALTQTVNMQTGQIDSINRKTADLQSGIDGVTERFESLRIEDNLLLNSSFNQNLNQWRGTGVTIVDGKARITGELNKTKYIYQSIKSQTANDDVSQVYIASISVKVSNYVDGRRNPYLALYIDGRKNDSTNTWFGGTYRTANRLDSVNNRGVVQFATTFRINVPRNQIKSLDFYIYARDFTGEVEFEKVSLRRGNIDLGWQASPEDLRSEIASYKRTADEASAELSRQIQTVDGKAVDAKTYAQQTATAINTRLESLETYKNEEGTRANQYLTASRTETAKQLSAERTAIATNYVAKSTYDENVRGTTLKLNDIKTTADTAKQNLATYQNTVDRKLTELISTTQTLDGKINTASAKITQNANEISKRLTSTQVDKAITDKGYQTKSDVDNNITGRGYITNSALQPYALATTVQNLVRETADSFSRTISETKALIPTEVGGRNYLLNSKTEISGGWSSKVISLSPELLNNLNKIKSVTISCDVEGTNVATKNSRKRYGLACSVEINGIVNYWEVWQTRDTSKKRISQTFTVPEGKSITKFYSPTLWIQADGNIKVSNPKLEFGVLPTDWSPAPEDFANELSSVKTTITQTASGVEQLSTSLTTTDSKVTTAEAKIRQLISDVSSKVSQTDYNTLTGRVDSAETAITQNATEISKRLTKTQVDKAITDKGYQTKSDVDSNITGRGYITNSALQPYALSTTVQNLVQETAGSFERQITETRGLIPTEVNQNLFDVVFSDLRATGGASFVQSDDGWIEVTIKNRWSGFHWYYSDDINPSKKQYVVSYEAYLVDTVAETARLESDFGSPDQLTLINKTPKRYTVVLNRPANIYNYINFVCDSSETGKKFRIRNIKLEEGIVATPYIAPFPTTVLFNAVKDTVDAHKRLIGNGDSISQAIQSANKFERSISSGGDVYQAIETAKGLVTEVSGTNGLKIQVSQLAGSWAVQNLTSSGQILNQINLLANGTNRIDGRLTHITGQTLIDNGVIINAMIGNLDAGKIKTGTLDAARIRANSIDGSKIVFDQAFLNKMTANEALFKQLFAQSAFITSVQAVAVSAKQIAGGIAKALNGGMDVNFDESKINFYTNVAAIRRIYTGHPTQFIKFETEGNYSRTIIGSNRNGGEVFNSATFAGIVVENTNNINTEDNVRIYGDNTLLRHAQGDVGWNINSVTQRIVPANINAESEIWSKHFVAPDKNSKPIRLDTAVAALWDIWNHIIYNNFEFNEALRTHIKARRDNWKFELNL